MSQHKDLVCLKPQEFVGFLKQNRIRKFFFVYDPDKGIVRSSHPQLQPIADFLLSDKRDFMQHEGLFFQITRNYGTLQGAFIHRTHRGQGSGGLRYWHYATVEDFLRDGLRLAKGMTFKNALAGLWWGGGKGIMVHNPAVELHEPNMRASLFQEFGEFVTSLRGCYITAEDVGTSVIDMANVFSKTRFITCIPYEFGGSGNPSVATAKGVVCGMEAALEFTGLGNLKGKTVAVQGVGHVATPLIEFLFEKNVDKVIAWDIDVQRVTRVKEQFAGKPFEASVISPDDVSIFQTDCDIFAPCATGAILNPQTISSLKAKIICGAANNQLEDDDRDDQSLHERGIVFVPDFLTNRMGIVHCANEQYGYVNHDYFIERHLSKDWEYSIYQTALKVLQASRETGDPPARTAIRMADELSLENHPIFGHRGQQIIASLVENRWHEQ
ncbi:Glu/Leu/Phe/Val dehydrogenase [bacterium]|nr:Glu/Leu/Phe/Val dehydrogenase [bacterium]